MEKYDVIIVGTGPAGMGAAFSLLEMKKDISILMIDKAPVSTGGMRNDCKMNFCSLLMESISSLSEIVTPLS